MQLEIARLHNMSVSFLIPLQGIVNGWKKYAGLCFFYRFFIQAETQGSSKLNRCENFLDTILQSLSELRIAAAEEN